GEKLRGKQAVAVARRLGVRKAGVRDGDVVRLLFDADAVAERDLVHRITAPFAARLMLARADRQDGAAAVAGSDDHVVRLGWAVHEVPPAQRSEERRVG